MSNQLWYFLLEGKYDENSGVFGSFFAHGTHCGEALHFAIEAARIQNILDPQVVEAERLDTLSDFVTPVDLVKVTDKASMKPNVHTFPLASEEKQFIPPKGIVKSTNDGEYDYSLIEEGFVAYGKNEEGVFEFELVAGIERLTTTFLQAIQILPRMELFYLCLKEHWEDSEEELWASSTISDTSDAVTFLTTHKENILENGHISCVVQEALWFNLDLGRS